MLGLSALACDGVVMRHGETQEVLACRVDANPLLDFCDSERGIDSSNEAAWIFDPGLPSASRPRLLSWSGTLAGGLFDQDPRNWTAPGRRAFDAFCDRVRPAFERHGWTLCFRPHARHVLSDVKGCRDFLARRTGQSFEIALAPASMLEASMLERIDDHLERFFAGLGSVAAMVILEDVRPAQPADDDRPLERVALGEGIFSATRLRSLLREHVSPETPVVLRGATLEAQRRWLMG